jgi:hypothetical protein
MIRIFDPGAPEVRAFRERIFVEDLGLQASDVATFDIANPVTDNKFAYWYSDQKFLSNNLDKVLLFYYEGQAIGMIGGSIFNKYLYRTNQGYYILKESRKNPELNTLHMRDGGFFDYQLARARELDMKGVFISIETFDRKHTALYRAMKNDRHSPIHMPNRDRKYTSAVFTYPEQDYIVKYVPQKICFYPLEAGAEFDALYHADMEHN